MPLDLAARRLWYAVGFEQDDRIEDQFVLARHLAADGVENRVRVRTSGSLDFGDDNQTRRFLVLDRERRDATGPDRLVRFFNSPLDVVRIVVQPANDD